MEKRYQVFVSSTFTDLQEERRKVIQTVMELDCFPAGMELFPAADEEQWEFIRRVIHDCDYYLLLIGGRYGSLTEEGISYTEKEYDYAVEQGIRVLAFLHKNPDEIPVSRSEVRPEAREKLEAFRGRVAQGRLVRFWSSAEALPELVALVSPKQSRHTQRLAGFALRECLPQKRFQNSMILGSAFPNWKLSLRMRESPFRPIL